MIAENEPYRMLIKGNKEIAMDSLNHSLDLIENDGKYPTDTDDVYYKFLASAMQMIGVK